MKTTSIFTILIHLLSVPVFSQNDGRSDIPPVAAAAPRKCPPFVAIFSADKLGMEPHMVDSTTGTVALLKDINPGTPSSSPGKGAVSGKSLYFWAEDRDTGYRIWKTDGTPESTVPLELDYDALRKKGNGTLGGAEGGFFIAGPRHVSRFAADTGKLSSVLDAKLQFSEFIEASDAMLARTTGTGYKKPSWIYEIPRSRSRAKMLVESLDRIDQIGGAARLGSRWLRAWPGYPLASLEKPASGRWAPLVEGVSIKTPGVLLGAKLIFGGQEVFKRPDGKEINKYGIELYETDGTAAGTKLLKDILDKQGDSEGSSPGSLTLCGKKVVFTIGVRGEPNRNLLWETDGTTGGTKLLKELPHNSNISNLTPAGAGAAFTVSTSGVGKDLWWTDGSADGTRLIMKGGAAGGGLQKLGDGVVFLGSADGKKGLWWSDGTGAAELISQLDLTPYSLLQSGELFAILPK